MTCPTMLEGKSVANFSQWRGLRSERGANRNGLLNKRILARAFGQHLMEDVHSDALGCTHEKCQRQNETWPVAALSGRTCPVVG